jgi:hypothetical protein
VQNILQLRTQYLAGCTSLRLIMGQPGAATADVIGAANSTRECALYANGDFVAPEDVKVRLQPLPVPSVEWVAPSWRCGSVRGVPVTPYPPPRVITHNH